MSKVLCWITCYSSGASGFKLCSTIIAIVVGVLDGDGSNGAFQIVVIAIQIPNVLDVSSFGRCFRRLSRPSFGHGSVGIHTTSRLPRH